MVILMIKNIFFDFNGTIIDDVDLCLDLLNQILSKQNKRTLNKDEYKHVFKFPIKQYYLDAGVDFNNESYEELSSWFINEYQPKSFHCGLYPNSREIFEYLKSKGYHLYILSASKVNNLQEQANIYDITKYFDAILGIDNIFAASKVQIAKDYIKANNINPKETIFIGDTLHDELVAKEIKAIPLLVDCGHQARDVLAAANVKILHSIADLKEVLENEEVFL